MKRIDSAVVAGTPARITVASKRTGRQVSVVLRPASTDQLSPSKAVGIPNWVPSEKAPQMGCHAGEAAVFKQHRGAGGGGRYVFAGRQKAAVGSWRQRAASSGWKGLAEASLHPGRACIA
jgi:hypothetical protein